MICIFTSRCTEKVDKQLYFSEDKYKINILFIILFLSCYIKPIIFSKDYPLKITENYSNGEKSNPLKKYKICII